jgi:peptidyl-prolyl cis-trans isomerase D
MALQAIRDSLQRQKWLAYVVVGALGVIFAAWGAFGIVNLNVGGTTYAAQAGGQTVSLEDARKAWLQTEEQQHLGNVQLPPQLTAQLQDQVLERLIRDALITQRAHNLGYRVSDQDLREAVHSEPAFQVSGVYSPELAKARLTESGISLDRFQTQLRSGLQREQLEMGIASSEFATPGELARSQELQSQEREVRYAVLPVDKFQAAAPDDAAVQAYYKAHQAQYMKPEWAHLQYGQLSLERLASQVKLTDEDLKAAYEKQKAQLDQPERRHAHHILIPLGKDDAAAKKLAEDVLAQAKSGKDFGALAKQYSQDTGSAQNGGDLGWSDRSAFVAPFADALFSMSPGEIRGPVKSEFGYHIIRLDEIQAGKTKSVEEARPDLEKQLRKDRATDRFGDIQEKLQQRMEQPGASLEAVAKEFGLETGEVTQFLRGSGGAPLGAAQEVQDLVFGDSALAPGRLGGPIVQGDDKLVIVKVLERHKPELKPLAEVRDSIVSALTKARSTDAALKVADAARGKLQSGASFDDVVRDLKVTSDPARFVGRTDDSILPELRQAAFDAPRPTGKPVYRTVTMSNGGAAIVQITKVRIPPAADKSQQTISAQQASQRDGMSEANAYVAQVRRTAKVEKNPKAFE